MKLKFVMKFLDHFAGVKMCSASDAPLGQDVELVSFTWQSPEDEHRATFLLKIGPKLYIVSPEKVVHHWAVSPFVFLYHGVVMPQTLQEMIRDGCIERGPRTYWHNHWYLEGSGLWTGTEIPQPQNSS